jgi:hypothetical protein
MLMKTIARFGFVLTVLSALAMAMLPAMPSFAAQRAPLTASQQALVDHAVRGDVVVLSPEQMMSLAQSNPALHAKLTAAHNTGTVPKLTPAEKRIVAGLTAQNLDALKAGHVWSAWVIVAIVAGVWLLLCAIANWGFPCLPFLARP